MDTTSNRDPTPDPRPPTPHPSSVTIYPDERADPVSVHSCVKGLE